MNILDITDMTPNPKHPLAAREVCRTLLDNGLISEARQREILEKKNRFAQAMEKRQTALAGGLQRIIHPVTIVDVIVAMNLKRADDPSKPLDEEAVFQALAHRWGLPYKKIDPLRLNLNLVTSIIPRSFAMKHLMLPVAVKDGVLTVATANPFNTEAMEDITRASQLAIRPVVSTQTDILKIIDEFFGFKRSIAAAEHQFSGPAVDLGNLEQYVRLKSVDELPSNDQHVVNAVNHLLGYAFDQRASDVHIEPKRQVSLVRLRIDGVLHTVYKLPKNVHSAIISRIKALSRLDMAEKRRPQDGRIKTDKEGHEVEIRVSTVPVAFGEKVVMRIMDPDILLQDLEQLGFSQTDLIRYNRIINTAHGIVLVCGPTGSGKSTTLYSTLQDLYTPEINVTTVEDPIEMVVADFNQIAVQPKGWHHFRDDFAQHPPPGPGHHHDRRDAGSGDCGKRRSGGVDRASGVFDPAHQRCPLVRHSPAGPGCAAVSRSGNPGGDHGPAPGAKDLHPLQGALRDGRRGTGGHGPVHGNLRPGQPAPGQGMPAVQGHRVLWQNGHFRSASLYRRLEKTGCGIRGFEYPSGTGRTRGDVYPERECHPKTDCRGDHLSGSAAGDLGEGRLNTGDRLSVIGEKRVIGEKQVIGDR